MNRDLIAKEIADALAGGMNPNRIVGELEDVAEELIEKWAQDNGWSKWGDDVWREDSACSICGSHVPGVCGHQDHPAQVVLRGRAAADRQRQAAEERTRVAGAAPTDRGEGVPPAPAATK